MLILYQKKDKKEGQKKENAFKQKTKKNYIRL